MRRTRVGLALICGLVSLAAPCAAGAASGSSVPVAGNWEGVGPHGIPLSFQLVRRGGHLVATSIALGSPASCPAVPRDAEAVPLGGAAYAGPGGRQSTGALPFATPAALYGRIPRTGQRVYLTGGFATGRSGSFSVQVKQPVGCGWPDKTLSWDVHPAHRTRVAKGTWTGPLTATGLINGNLRVVIGAEGRVVESFTSFFTCLSDTQQGNTIFRAAPAYEFVRPDGSFYSPVNGGLVRGHHTIWSGRFSASGRLTGTLTIFDNCTNRLIKARFSGRPTR